MNNNVESSGIDLANFSFENQLVKVENIHPQGWNVLVQLYIEPKQRKSGLITPDSYHNEQKHQSCQGFVLKIAKGVYDSDRYKETGPWCKVGDCVIFSPYSGIKIHRGDDVYVFLKEDMIEAVVTNPAQEIPKISK